jgi:Zn-dependent protease with chaperone function
MLGLLLYILTLLLETLSVACRFLLVAAPATMAWGNDVGMLVGSIFAGGPILYSLLVMSGMPSGHGLVRHAFRARHPTPAELQRIEATYDRILSPHASRPHHTFVIDTPGINAWVSGTSLFIKSDLLRTHYLAPVLAHEFGHLHSLDGRLVLALRVLVIPGAFTLSRLLLALLYLLQRFILFVTNALVRAVGGGHRLVAVLQVLFNVFLDMLPYLLIIFAMGGVGPKILGRLWCRYFIRREYRADAYAAKLGQGPLLVELFRQLMLIDVEVPWSKCPTHPTTAQRIQRLVETGRHY